MRARIWTGIRPGGSTKWCLQAIYHGKPIVALPFFGDQSNNADKLINKACLLNVSTVHIGAQGPNHFAVACGAGSTTGKCCLLAAGCMFILHVRAPAQPRSGLHMLSAFACLQYFSGSVLTPLPMCREWRSRCACPT